MQETMPAMVIAESVDLARLERTLRASIALMKRSRRQLRRDPRADGGPDRPDASAEARAGGARVPGASRRP